MTVRVGFPGTTAVIPQELNGCNCASMMIIRKSDEFDSDWLCAIMNSHIGRNQIEGVQYGTAQKQFNISDAIHFIFPVPPLPEQQRIAEALSDVDALIASLEKLIAKKKAIKQGAMQRLLTGKTRLPGFEGEWEEHLIQDCCEILDNLRVPVASSLRKSGNIPYYGANGIQDYVEGFTHNGEFVLVAEDGANDLAHYPVQHVCGKIWVNNHAHVLKGKDGILSTSFLAYILRMVDYQSILVGGTRAKLNGSVLKNISIQFPNLSDQKEIANILLDIDEEIKRFEQKLAKTRQLKQGMMQQLLTGKIRLI